MLKKESLLPMIGISTAEGPSPTLVAQLLNHYRQRPDALLKIIAVLEFGVVDPQVRSPIRAGFSSGMLLFIVGSLPKSQDIGCPKVPPRNKQRSISRLGKTYQQSY